MIVTIMTSESNLISAIPRPKPTEPRYKEPQLPHDAEAKIKAVLPGKPQVEPKTPRKLLVIWECGIYRKSGPYACKLLEMMGKKTGAYEVDILRSSPLRRRSTEAEEMDKLINDNIKQYDAVLFMNFAGAKPSEKYEKLLIDVVKNGKGIILLNAGINTFSMSKNQEIHKMIGGRGGFRFKGQDASWPFLGAKFMRTIRVDALDSPATKAFDEKEFDRRVEVPRISKPCAMDDKTVLLSIKMKTPLKEKAEAYRTTTVSMGDDYHPVAWIKSYGKGRVFYSGFGYMLEDYQDAKIVNHILAGIQYALGDLK